MDDPIITEGPARPLEHPEAAKSKVEERVNAEIVEEASHASPDARAKALRLVAQRKTDI